MKRTAAQLILKQNKQNNRINPITPRDISKTELAMAVHPLFKKPLALF